DPFMAVALLYLITYFMVRGEGASPHERLLWITKM
ncbi:MAG: hypothetical protein XD51_0258, partial [Moorella sp. 60_41]